MSVISDEIAVMIQKRREKTQAEHQRCRLARNNRRDIHRLLRSRSAVVRRPLPTMSHYNLLKQIILKQGEEEKIYGARSEKKIGSGEPVPVAIGDN